jgi:type IV secretion system protein VirB11
MIQRSDRSLSVREMMRKYGISDALRSDITEFAINSPGAFWVEDELGWHCHDNELLTLNNLQGLSAAIAVFNQKPLNRDSPIASLTLPDGERCQIVLPPACPDGQVLITIRKPSDVRFSIDEYRESGRLNPKVAVISDTISESDTHMLELIAQNNFSDFFKCAVENRLNIVTVGGTGSGKTTFSKALIDLYPADKRLFTIEDAHELTTPNHPNSVHLFFSTSLSAREVLASCMRMKPDHIFITELRGDESWDYLMALKSGHSGSVTSVHANDCRGAMYKIASYIKQSDIGKTMDFSYIIREVMTTIDVVAYFNRTKLLELYFDPWYKMRLISGDGLVDKSMG